MAERKEYRKFRELLTKGIGDKTQKQFAEECGISREHLGRILNTAFIARPSKTTLRKLASNMENVSLPELYEACDYTDEAAVMTKSESELTERQKRIKLSVWERVMENINDLKEGLKSFDKTNVTSLSGIFEYLQTFFLVENVTFTTRNIKASDGHMTAAIEAVCNIETLKAVVIFCIDFQYQGEDILVDSFSFDGKTVSGWLTEEEMDNFKKYGIDILAHDEVLLMYNSEESAEARLLESIFGDDGIETVAIGFGFYLEKVPPHFWDFLKTHNYSSPVEEGDPEKVFEDHDGGYPAIIAEIMSRETGFSFDAWVDTGEFADNPTCVICEGVHDQDVLETTVYKYAKELGVEYIQTCYFRYRTYKDNQKIKVE